MSVPFAGALTRSAGLYSAIAKQLKSVNLKPVKKVVFTFDPFRPNVASIRDTLFLFSSERVNNTNLRCTVKADVVDNVEPTVAVTLEQGRNIVFKTENLTTLEFLQEFNKIILPLVPKEEELTGKKAVKIAGAKASAAKKPIKKK